MATDYGTDFDGIDDIDANLAFQTDTRLVLAQSLCRQLQMPRGALWYAPDEGYDIRSIIADTGPDPSAHEQAIEAQCLKDERVQNAVCEVNAVTSERWEVSIAITPVTGQTFQLVLSVDAVTVTILEA